MAHPASRGSPKLVLTIAALTMALVVACDRESTAPSPRASLPGAPSRTLDPGQDYTTNPNDGCWIAPDSSVFDAGSFFGGVLPYTFTRCGVSMNVSWPTVTSNGVTSPLTTVFPGYDTYAFPWGNKAGNSLAGDAGGFPWTITFDQAVRNVRVYTRIVDYAGGVVNVRGAFANLIASKPIPVHPGTITDGSRDTIAFADTNVYIVEIVPALDPNHPPVTGYPDMKEMIGWQAQFERAPCPPNNDPLANTKAFRDSINAEFDRSVGEDKERAGWFYKNFSTGEIATRYNFGSWRDQCQVIDPSYTPPPLDGFIALAGFHTHIRAAGQPVGIGCRGVPMSAIAENGISGHDTTYVKKTGMRHYVIDGDELFAMETDLTFTTYPWTKKNGCR